MHPIQAFLRAAPTTLLRGHGHYWFHKGQLPVCLVAHVDTVHSTPTRVFHDHEQNILWSPTGLGADDRAGVYAINVVRHAGYDPSVLLCDHEESGGRGASLASAALSDSVRDCRLLIELDRRGKDDAVYYDCGSKRLRHWVTEFGFHHESGTFSDISILGPAWDLAAVNLSIGYTDEHTLQETLDVTAMDRTITRVKAMLDNLPANRLPHETEDFAGFGYDGGYTQWRGAVATSRQRKPTTLIFCPKPSCYGHGARVTELGDYYICDRCSYSWAGEVTRSRKERRQLQKGMRK